MDFKKLQFKDHVKLLDDADEDFFIYFYDHRVSKKQLIGKILKGAELTEYDTTVLIALDSKRAKNEKVEQMAGDISEELEQRGLDHTLHVFFVDKDGFDQLKSIKVKQI